NRVTVLRQGRVTYAGPLQGQSERSLAEAMIGAPGSPRPVPPRNPRGPGPVVVRAAGLELRAGELVGIAAIEGNGQRELLRAIAGVVPLRGAAVEVARPVAFIPEDRTTEGLIPSLTLTENLVLGLPNDRRWRRGPWLDWR